MGTVFQYTKSNALSLFSKQNVLKFILKESVSHQILKQNVLKFILEESVLHQKKID